MAKRNDDRWTEIPPMTIFDKDGNVLVEIVPEDEEEVEDKKPSG